MGWREGLAPVIKQSCSMDVTAPFWGGDSRRGRNMLWRVHGVATGTAKENQRTHQVCVTLPTLCLES